MKCYVIHLQSAIERGSIVRAIQDMAQLRVVVVDAVDKNTLQTNAERSRYQKNLLSPTYPFILNDGEVACFLSHRKVWQLIVDGEDDFALVLEDDVQLKTPLFFSELGFVMRNIGPDDVVRFPRTPLRDPGVVVATNAECFLVKPILPGLQTCALVVGKSAARKLLDFTEKFDRPIDSVLQMVWAHQVPIYAVLPPGIVEIGRGSGRSLIQSKSKRVWATLRREYLRFRYRSAISRSARIHEVQWMPEAKK